MASLKETVLRALPPRFRQGAVDLKNALVGGYRRFHYSQFGEDIVVTRILPKRGGFYVDVGANHPSRYSNTRLLYERGWHGVNIDPDPEAISRFKSARPRDISLALGVSKEGGVLTLYRFSDPAFNTFSTQMKAVADQKSWLSPLPSLAVPVLPLKKILQEQVPEGVSIDFLNVDVEGLDYDVLISNDWERFAPRVVCVEDHTFTVATPETSSTYALLTSKGYMLKAHMGPTLIFEKS